MNIITLGTARGEYEFQMLGERIESGGHGPFKYIIIISNEQRTRDDPQLPEPYCTCDCRNLNCLGYPALT
jgi:hypothetical protein